MNLPTIVVAIVAVFFFTSCNDSHESNMEKVNKDSVVPLQMPATAKSEPVILKDAVLNETTLVSKHILTASHQMDVNDFRNLSIRKVDSTGGDENGFSYHVVDTLFSKPALTVLLIGREYISENIVWLVVYGNDHKLIDHLQVYYDNAEGFLSVETIIKNNEISVTTKTDFDEGTKNKTEKYRLDDAGKRIKL